MKPGFAMRLLAACAGAAALLGCSSNDGPVGGAVTGEVDMHCVMNDAKVAQAVGMCLTGEVDAGAAAPDAGAGGGGNGFGPPIFNAEGDDDDCKYHVKWTSTPVRRTSDITFSVNVVRLFDGMPAKGAGATIDAVLNDVYPTPSSNIGSSEPSDGNYKIGPVKLDKSGRWVVRFHFYETCSDIPDDSPHGHIAFYVDVP
jgi:hypothetical protein